MRTDNSSRPKELQPESMRLRRAVSDLALDTLILKDTAREPSQPRPTDGVGVARRIQLVTAASADSTVQPSMNGSSGAPKPPISIRRFMTENQTKPSSSAQRP